MNSDPRAEYAARLAAARDDEARRAATAGRVSNLRLAVFAAGVVLAWMVFATRSLPPLWLAPPVVAFSVLVVWHDRLLRLRERAARRVAFYERGSARLEDRWAGGGASGLDFADRDHPYAADLDLFGSGSLFELLCTARTREGEQRLADWLKAPAAPAEVRARQQAVEELRPGLELREDLATLGADVRSRLHAEAVREWGEAAPVLSGGAARVAALLLPAFTVSALVAWLFFDAAPLSSLVGLAAQMGFAAALRPRVRRVIGAVDLPGRDLELLADLLARIEAESFGAPHLARLRAALDTQGVPPSRRLARLRLRIDLLDARRNQLFAPIAALLLWTTHVAFAIEGWRRVCGPSLGAWIDAVAELEALAALAGYAYEHPEHPFPELVEGERCLQGEELGHPLLPRDRCVTNDVALGGDLRVLIVSGSNMSGKSTWLRTLGTNAVLAYAGAPVCARRLRLAPLAIGASIRVEDSLQEGSSRFYAEIRRLRHIVELAEGEGSVLFLLDEILHGTNSHDRGIGAEAVVRGLLQRGALGLVTTHDLALARIADSLAPRVSNVHFEDHLEDGRIAFDYRIRPGVVQKSNALALMRAVGLDV